MDHMYVQIIAQIRFNCNRVETARSEAFEMCPKHRILDHASPRKEAFRFPLRIGKFPLRL